MSRRALYDKMRDYGLDGEASAMRTEAGIMGPRKVDLDESMMPKPRRKAKPLKAARLAKSRGGQGRPKTRGK